MGGNRVRRFQSGRFEIFGGLKKKCLDILPDAIAVYQVGLGGSWSL
jgi:hypothetical protein